MSLQTPTGPKIGMLRAILWAGAIFAMLIYGAVFSGYLPFGQKGRSALNTTPITGIGGSFSLINANGENVTDKTFLGKPFIVFFGFTHCPDICPATLFEMSEVMRASGDKGRDLRALYISVDPERDTVEVLKNYTSSFDPRVIALTGDVKDVQEATRVYRAYAKKIPTKDQDYTMDHTTSVYLMDKNGQFLRLLDLKRAPENVAKDLLELL
jgi:protein SCO1